MSKDPIHRDAPDDQPRFLLYYLHPVSARLLFVQHATGSIFTPRPLTLLSSPIEDEPELSALSLQDQLALGLALNADLGFEAGMLVVDRQFRRRAEIPRAKVDFYLARFTSIDIPVDAVQTLGAEFRSIGELQGRHPVEMAMLRWAFDYLIGG